MIARKISLFLACITLIVFAGVFQSTAQDPELISEDPDAPLIIAPISAESLLAAHDGLRDALNAQDVDMVMSYFTEDAIYNYVGLPVPMNGKEEIAVFFAGVFQAFPDFHVEQRSIMVSGDVMTTECTITATFLGDWMGIPATGINSTSIHMDVYDFEGDKIKHLTTYDDNVSFMINAGVMPAPEPQELIPSFTLLDPVATGISPLEAAENLVATYNTHDMETYSTLIHPDSEGLIAPLGVPINRDEVIALFESQFMAYSDLFQDVVRMVDMGDGWVLAETVFSGVNDGPLSNGAPATGNSLNLPVGWLVHIDADGLMTNIQVYWDDLTQLMQLGLFPPPPDLLAIHTLFHEEVVNSHDAEAVASFFAEDGVFDYVPAPPPAEGREAIAGFFDAVYQAFPDWQCCPDGHRRNLVSGNMIVTECYTTGTHEGDWGGVPGTGNVIETIHMDVYEFEGSEIKRLTTYDDNVSVFVQMGVMPVPNPLELIPSTAPPEPEAPGLPPLEAAENIAAVWNTGDIENYISLTNSNVEVLIAPLNATLDRDAFMASQELYFMTYPDLQQEIVRMVDMGDGWVLTEVVFIGTNDGPYYGLPATGNTVAVRGAWLAHFDADGLMTYMSVYWDELTTMMQLGLFPPPPDPKDIARRGFEDVWNAGDMDAVDEILAPDVVVHDAAGGDVVGTEAFRQFVAVYRTAFPDINFEIEDIIAEGNSVALRWTSTGTHLGDLMGIPPNGMAGPGTTGMTITHIADGMEVESWNSWDVLGLMQWLGVVTPPRPGPENFVWGEPSDVTGDPGDPETNKAFILQHVEDLWNSRNVDSIDEIASPEIIGHNPPVSHLYSLVGIDSFKEAASDHLNAFPDFHVTIHEAIAESDKVMLRWTVTGTHEGELMGIPATGAQVEFSGMTLYRLADGKLVEHWWAYDVMGLMQQLTAAATEMANKALVRRIYEEVWNQQNLDLIDELAAPDFVAHNPPSPDANGTEAYKAMIAMYLAAIPDSQWVIEDEIASGDLVTFRMTGTGTHQGEFMGIPASGVNLTVIMISTVRIVDGKIVETWSNADQLGLMQQLGVMPATREDYTWGAPSEVTGNPGNPQTNVAAIQSIFSEVFVNGNLDAIDESFAADFIMHDPVVPMEILGPEGYKQVNGMYFVAFPDIQITADAMVAEGDEVAIRWTLTGTHTGEFMGIPATGRRITATGISIYRFADGKVVEIWASYDALGMMQQLTMSQEEYNKSVSRRDFEEGLNQRRLEVYDEIIAADAVLHTATGDIPGREGIKVFVGMYIAAFPDLNFTIDDMVAEGDMVGIRWSTKGTHQGELMGIPPTGTSTVGTGMSIQRISGGQIQESWLFGDDLGTMQQLGVVTPGRPIPENYMWGAPLELTGEPGTPEQNEALVVRFVDEFWNQGNMDTANEMLSDSLISHNPPISPMYPSTADGLKQYASDVSAAFPDFQVSIDDLVSEGGKVVVRWTASGTQQADFLGIPAAGRYVSVPGTTIYRFADGKMVEFWWSWDTLGMMQQLTAVPDGYDNVFFTTLSAGLNMISVPLEPVVPFTARSLAEYISATVVIRYDESLGKFMGFTPGASGDGFSIEGGKGYIVNVLADTTVTFTGAAWTNEPPVAAAPPTQDSGAWAFLVSGSVIDGDMMTASDGDCIAIVKNLRTGEIFTEAVGTDGYFAAAWADLSRKAVIGAGDKIEVAVVDSSGSIVSGPFIHDITLDSIRNAVVNVHLKLGDIIPVESALLQNYPNPFNPETWIPYHLSHENPVVIKIYGISGQLIRTLDMGHRDAGLYVSKSKAAYWDGKNEAGEQITSGVYFYIITAGDFSAMRKMVVTR